MSQEIEKTGRRKAAFQTPAHEDRFSASGRFRSGLDHIPHGTPAALREADEDVRAICTLKYRLVDEIVTRFHSQRSTLGILRWLEHALLGAAFYGELQDET